MTIYWKAGEQYFTVVLLVFLTQFVILENLSVLDLALLGLNGLTNSLYFPPDTVTTAVAHTMITHVTGKRIHVTVTVTTM